MTMPETCTYPQICVVVQYQDLAPIPFTYKNYDYYKMTFYNNLHTICQLKVSFIKNVHVNPYCE